MVADFINKLGDEN